MNSADPLPPTLLIRAADPSDLPAIVILNAEASRHVKALRLRDGDRVRITNGRGGMWTGRMESGAHHNGAHACRLEEALPTEVLLPLVLGFGVGAKTRTLWLLEKAVELGVGVLQPVEFARSASVSDAARSPAFWQKARRRAEAALEQSGGAWLPEVRDPTSLPALLEECSARPAGGTGVRRLLLAADGRTELTDALLDWDGWSVLALLVGPEGGLEAKETHAVLEHGFRRARLGPRTLRFETAAIAASAVVSQRAAGRIPAATD